MIFDKDGTLENSHPYLRQLTIKRVRLLDAQIPGIGEPLAMAFGLVENKLDPQGLMAVGSRWENEVAAAAYIAETGRSWYESLAIAKSCFKDADSTVVADAETCPIFASGLDLIEQFFLKGVKLAIVSAARTSSVKRFVEDHHLSHKFNLLLGSDQGLHKPDPALYHYACEQLQVSPGATLMIGDSEGDMTMARQAGAQAAIAVNWPHLPSLSFANADAVVTDLSQIQIIHP